MFKRVFSYGQHLSDANSLFSDFVLRWLLVLLCEIDRRHSIVQ